MNRVSKFPARTALVAALLSVGVLQAASAQSFLPGGLIVSRTVYSGTAAPLVAGQALPGTNAGVTGSGFAVAGSAFPSVFTNEQTDASFGVTSAIYLDQINTSNNSVVATTAIDSSQMTSSFASKSELALNISTDGTSVSFMGYAAPAGALDVSNSNTPGLVDPTNPDTAASYAREIANVNLSTGATTFTTTNAYSGNNGRAAILDSATGTYYTVGNSGNGGSGAPLGALAANTGVQSISINSTNGVSSAVGAYNTAGSTPTGTVGNQYGFSLAQTNPLTGQAYGAADKTGKDDNFRGETVYNNTLFVTKGSGGNGINTVYQVGATGALANGGTLTNATITPLAGFPLIPSKSTAAQPHPFGLYFGNSTTLFVADEGDGLAMGAAGKSEQYAGLQEWKLNTTTGIWGLAQTFQSGLIGQVSTPAGLSWNVQQDGLRNITGKQNADGSFTIYATTSTISNDGNHDLGADPNEIVSINVGDNSTAANTAFSVVEVAQAGTRLGGVAMAPVPEPESYALLLGGLGLIGAAVRRRKNAAA